MTLTVGKPRDDLAGLPEPSGAGTDAETLDIDDAYEELLKLARAPLGEDDDER